VGQYNTARKQEGIEESDNENIHIMKKKPKDIMIHIYQITNRKSRQRQADYCSVKTGLKRPIRDSDRRLPNVHNCGTPRNYRKGSLADTQLALHDEHIWDILRKLAGPIKSCPVLPKFVEFDTKPVQRSGSAP